MAKLMAPNIRIDWYPEGHFKDPSNPTSWELNSGYNLSQAIVTGFTLDFTDPETQEVSGVFSNFTIQVYDRDGYEANLQFFLAPRNSNNGGNEEAYRRAEALFYKQESPVGYLVKRFGYDCGQQYGEGGDQRIDIFKVQADVPKVVTEEGEPILLDVRFIPQGFAKSAALAPRIPPPNSYEWDGLPGYSESHYYDENSRVAKRNVIPDPSLEYGNDSFIRASGGHVTFEHVTEGFYGEYAMKITPTLTGSPTPPQHFQIHPVNALSLMGKWVGFAYIIKSSIDGFITSELLTDIDSVNENLSIFEDRATTNEYRRVRSEAVYIPEGAQSIWIHNVLYSSERGMKRKVPLREDFYIDGLQWVVGDSEEEVTQQLETFFDGDGEFSEVPPPAEVYTNPTDGYYWEYEAGESESIYFNESGEITKRNYMRDPSFEYFNISQLHIAIYTEYDIIDHPDALYGSRVLKFVPDSTQSNPPQIQFRPMTHELFFEKWLGFALSIKLTEPKAFRAHMYIGFDNTRVKVNTYVTDRWETIYLPPTEIPSGASNVRVVIFFYDDSGENVHLDESHEVLIDGLQMVRGDSAEDVDYQLETYFDGDGEHPRPANIEFAWLGEPHASPSVKLVDGEIVAINHVPGNLAWTVGNDDADLLPEYIQFSGAYVDSPEFYEVPAGVSSIQLHYQVRTNVAPAGYNTGRFFSAIGVNGSVSGSVETFPNDGEWHSISASRDVSPGDTIMFRFSNVNPDRYSNDVQVRNIQLGINSEDPGPYFNGDTV